MHVWFPANRQAGPHAKPEALRICENESVKKFY
jgi:hypothetical protein